MLAVNAKMRLLAICVTHCLLNGKFEIVWPEFKFLAPKLKPHPKMLGHPRGGQRVGVAIKDKIRARAPFQIQT